MSLFGFIWFWITNIALGFPFELSAVFFFPSWLLTQSFISLQYINRFSALPGWRRFKRRRSSSGKGPSWRSLLAWPLWVPSQSRPTFWRRRRTKTCCSNEALCRSANATRHPIYLCLSGCVCFPERDLCVHHVIRCMCVCVQELNLWHFRRRLRVLQNKISIYMYNKEYVYMWMLVIHMTGQPVDILSHIQWLCMLYS